MVRGTIERLFIPFEQAVDAEMPQAGGLGLGLSISQELVRARGGTITASSPGPGQGSTFFVRLPSAHGFAQLSSATDGPEPVSESEDTLRILLLEDHSDTVAVISQILRQLGHKVDESCTLAEALQRIEKSVYDVVLFDLNLPDGTGFEFIEILRQSRQTPAIAITGFGMPEDIEKCSAAGFVAYINKPVTVQQLRQTLRRIVADRARNC
jgi:CheY-like chemotaxis protein